MDPERWRQVESIFNKALEVGESGRAGVLEKSCAGDEALRREVESLLAQHEKADAFIERPAFAGPADVPLSPRPRSVDSNSVGIPAGTVIGHYRIVGKIGSGGMGVVYEAEDLKLRRHVALKFLPEEVTEHSQALQRFRLEARAASALNHPNICTIYEVDEVDGRVFIAMELLEGRTLKQTINQANGGKPLPLETVIDFGIQIARAIDAAHSKGIVHRDIKPANIFVMKQGRVKVLDFGLAKLVRRHPGSDETDMTDGTEPGMVMGTVGYMSPEQVRGQAVDGRTDIFAFGAILYEMLARRRAFEKPTSSETLAAILNEEPPAISQLATGTPPALARVIRRCLQKDPEQRFQSASDLAFALEALSDFGSAPTATLPARSRSRWVWVAATGFLAVLVAALIVWWRVPRAVPIVESITQVTDDGEPKASITSDGSRIYFDEGTIGSLRLAQVSVAGGPTAPVQTRLVNCKLVGNVQDGSGLLVAVGSLGEAPYTLDPLWMVPLPIGEPRRIDIFGVVNVDIFPDGRIVFARYGKDVADWFIADKDGSNTHELISLPGEVGWVAAPPAGQRILIVQQWHDDRRLLEIDADGKGLREIKKLADEYNFRWTSDEKYLVYQSGNDSQSNIWLLPMQSGLLRSPGKPVRLTNGPLPYSHPTPSRDGRQIFVLGTKQRGELVRYDLKSHQFQPLLSGISATDPTFSRDGKWVAYASYPEHTLWRSRSDGTERMQLTFPPIDVRFPMISPDGTKVAFHTDQDEIFVLDMQGGRPQKVTENASYASWSPDGNYLLSNLALPPFNLQITDVRTGKNSVVPSSEGMSAGFWLSQDAFVVRNPNGTRLVVFNLRTRQWADMTAGISAGIENFFPSPDGKYLDYTTGGADPKALRYRFADHQIETITSLAGFHRAVNSEDTQINVAPDGSPIFTRDTGYQEIYALNIRWPK